VCFWHEANGNNTYEGTRTRVAYNEINLPQQVQLLGGRGIKNVYAADERKLKSEAKQGNEYIKEGTKTYSGNLVFDINDELDYIIFNEGRILYNIDDNTFKYEYHLKDHLGSTRVAFVPMARGTEVVQENNYYPFGTPIADLSWSPKSTNRYGYNGKEHVKEFDLAWIDYGARVYNPIIGRWSMIDPLANKYYDFSSYAYCLNNTLKFIDPDGKKVYFAPGVSQEFKAQFAIAVQYLNEKGAAGMLAKLHASNNIYYIAEGNNNARFRYNTNTIIWDPDMGLLTNENVVMSPTSVLNHEIDHALQFDTNKEKFMQDIIIDPKVGKYDTPEEKRVITGSEQITAKKLGEIKEGEVTRTDHRGILYETKGVKSTEGKNEITVTPNNIKQNENTWNPFNWDDFNQDTLFPFLPW
jgi:RHS repeat-associated protein